MSDSDADRIDPEDKARCQASVLDARERIAHVCDLLQARTNALPPLRAMEKACMDYLNFDERDEVAYVRALGELRRELIAHENELLAVAPELELEEPGSRDGAAPGWLSEPKLRDRQ